MPLTDSREAVPPVLQPVEERAGSVEIRPLQGCVVVRAGARPRPGGELPHDRREPGDLPRQSLEGGRREGVDGGIRHRGRMSGERGCGKPAVR